MLSSEKPRINKIHQIAKPISGVEDAEICIYKKQLTNVIMQLMTRSNLTYKISG